MIDHEAAWRAHQRARWMQPDAQRWMSPDAARWIRPDVGRFLKPGTDPADVFPALDRKYSATQRRVPAGQPGGGRWTDEEERDGGGIDSVAQTDGSTATDPERGDDVTDEGSSEGSVDSSTTLTPTNSESLEKPANSQRIDTGGINDPRVISDADPETVKPGEQYAQNRRGGGGPFIY
jgi:hypothetical protein